MVSIGLPCEPEWLCNAITWVLVILVAAMTLRFLILVIKGK